MIKVNNREMAHMPGMTVKSLLEFKHYTFPDIIVRVNGTYIAPESYAETEIQDGDDVLALHMFGGG
jgi:sulfur carrier protein